MRTRDSDRAGWAGSPGAGVVTGDPEVAARRAPLDVSTSRRGTFITFEGIEGSGKSTQVGRLSRRLQRAWLSTVATREPGGTSLGRQLRATLLCPAERPMTPLTELLLYIADRAQHISEVIEPALSRGDLVLCDRYRDATLAYQGYGRGLDLEMIARFHVHSPLDLLPERTLLFDLDPLEALARARARNRSESLAASEGRFEAERLEFHQRVRDGYLALAAAEPDRIRLVDGGGEPDEVEARVLAVLLDLVPHLGDEPC